jgi:hypothetical protein
LSIERWLARAEASPPIDDRPRYARRYWQVRERRARLS